MDFTKTFRAIWWAVLLIAFGIYLYGRFPHVVGGSPSWFDGLVFCIWTVVALGPFFNQIEIYGLKFKREIKELKDHVTREISSIRNDVRVAADTAQSVNQQFHLGFPIPPDSKLQDIEVHIKRLVEEQMKGRTPPPKDVEDFIASPNTDRVDALIKARYTIEREVREIFDLANFAKPRRLPPLGAMLRVLNENDILPEGLSRAIKEVYAVCSLAIHGEEVSDAQVEFVRSTAPELIAALKSISQGLNWEYCT